MTSLQAVNGAHQIDRKMVVDHLIREYGDRRGYACLGAVFSRTRQNPKGVYKELFYRWPDERRELLNAIVSAIRQGADVYLPSTLCRKQRRWATEVMPTSIISCEIDQVADKAHTQKVLKELGAGLVSSGTKGHFHVRVQLDKELNASAQDKAGEYLYRILRPVEGGTQFPNGLLRVPGTLNFKQAVPQAVRLIRPPQIITVARFKQVVKEHKTEIHWRASAFRSPAETLSLKDITPQAIPWADVSPVLRWTYKAIPNYVVNTEGRVDASRGAYAFWCKCFRKGLTVGQVLYLSTDGDDLGYLPSRYADNPQSLIRQLVKAFEAVAAEGH